MTGRDGKGEGRMSEMSEDVDAQEHEASQGNDARMNLIEEAANAILDAAETPESVRDERVREWARRDARAALAVFEKAQATDWEYREQVIAGFPRPKNVRIERQRRRPAGPWEQVPDDDTTPKGEA